MATTTDQAVRHLLDEGRARARRLGPDQVRLWDALARSTEGGKRFRPALVVAAHDALGGTRQEAAAATGAAIELLHTALVVHDDVIDGDDVRRGRPNVSGTFRAGAREAGADAGGADALALAAGILAGDLALATAVRAVATCGAPRDVTERLLDLLDAALHTTAAGELADVTLSLGLGAASMAESLDAAERKTSAYSFALPLQAGAVLADADEHTVERLGEAGRVLGIGFQLVDDLLGVFGDPARTGKSTTSDLRDAKQTPLLVHARSTSQWARLEPYVGRDLAAADLAEARALLTASGSRAFVEALAARHHASAVRTVEELDLPVDVLGPLLTSFGLDEAAA
ncbi:geranylgeranyl pyrophosphate synthase [Nocardioides sp. OK12]|uniref:polyprenyl synthetase family protein n=1 Tax=Nocardioides sp. OK12 TaxID=2758661 RepID=UPI0021C31F5A|nr:polyprenyl synthetase family protein [Nocardioides sp. OK12]GHJ57958.1 geranylgeranyl pyrophosphate synthase [Nocardioides sp. OK12]